MIGASVAWHLTQRPDFEGSVLVIERDPSYAHASTSHTNSCMRQQFSAPVNIRISQYCAEFINNFQSLMPDVQVPEIHTDMFGYLYLASSPDQAHALHAAHAAQTALGVPSRLLSPEETAHRWPFMALDGITLASINTHNEGYFDGATIFAAWRSSAKRAGTTFLADEVVGLTHRAGRVNGVRLKSGRSIGCGTLVNAAGPRAAQVARMAGLSIPVEPRKRYTYVFSAATPLDRPLPLTVDPSGVHVRSDGANYMAGAAPEQDVPVAPDDFSFDHTLWERRVWPVIAARIPAFEAVKVRSEWVGHYAYNRLDQNALVGTLPEMENMIFVNGFSGHGLQQAPAMGRGVAELICTGHYETLDLSPLSVDRILRGARQVEAAII